MPLALQQQGLSGNTGGGGVLKLLTVKSCWLLSLPDDSHTLRRKMEDIREALARFTGVLWWIRSLQPQISCSRLFWVVLLLSRPLLLIQVHVHVEVDWPFFTCHAGQHCRDTALFLFFRLIRVYLDFSYFVMAFLLLGCCSCHTVSCQSANCSSANCC